jgi:hypothetical protein
MANLFLVKPFKAGGESFRKVIWQGRRQGEFGFELGITWGGLDWLN